MTLCWYPEDYGCTNSRCQVTWVTECYWWHLIFLGPQYRTYFMSPRILMQLLYVWKMCGPLLKRRKQVLPKCHKSINPYGIISHETGVFASPAMRISNLRGHVSPMSPCSHWWVLWQKESLYFIWHYRSMFNVLQWTYFSVWRNLWGWWSVIVKYGKWLHLNVEQVNTWRHGSHLMSGGTLWGLLKNR